MLPVQVQGADYVLGTEKLPSLSASASRDAAGVIHISLVNIDAKKAQSIVLRLKGTGSKKISGRILSASAIQDHNTFAQPEKVSPAEYKGAKWQGDDLRVELPACSVVVLTLN
jgi:alpha-N-arabinofuranosidase